MAANALALGVDVVTLLDAPLSWYRRVVSAAQATTAQGRGEKVKLRPASRYEVARLDAVKEQIRRTAA